MYIAITLVVLAALALTVFCVSESRKRKDLRLILESVKPLPPTPSIAPEEPLSQRSSQIEADAWRWKRNKTTTQQQSRRDSSDDLFSLAYLPALDTPSPLSERHTPPTFAPQSEPHQFEGNGGHFGGGGASHSWGDSDGGSSSSDSSSSDSSSSD